MDFQSGYCHVCSARILPPGLDIWGRCCLPPALSFPLRCRTWCIRTERLLASTWAQRAWGTYPLSPRESQTCPVRDMEMWKLLNVVVCADRIQKVPRLLVASLDGHLYIYNLDLQEGGDCRLVKKHRWARGSHISHWVQKSWMCIIYTINHKI